MFFHVSHAALEEVKGTKMKNMRATMIVVVIVEIFPNSNTQNNVDIV